MDERLRYPFLKDARSAENDRITFRSYTDGLITKAYAIDQISRNNGYRMTPQQFDYYLVALGYRREKNDE